MCFLFCSSLTSDLYFANGRCFQAILTWFARNNRGATFFFPLVAQRTRSRAQTKAWPEVMTCLDQRARQVFKFSTGWMGRGERGTSVFSSLSERYVFNRLYARPIGSQWSKSEISWYQMSKVSRRFVARDPLPLRLRRQNRLCQTSRFRRENLPDVSYAATRIANTRFGENTFTMFRKTSLSTISLSWSPFFQSSVSREKNYIEKHRRRYRRTVRDKLRRKLNPSTGN